MTVAMAPWRRRGRQGRGRHGVGRLAAGGDEAVHADPHAEHGVLVHVDALVERSATARALGKGVPSARLALRCAALVAAAAFALRPTKRNCETASMM